MVMHDLHIVCQRLELRKRLVGAVFKRNQESNQHVWHMFARVRLIGLHLLVLKMVRIKHILECTLR